MKNFGLVEMTSGLVYLGDSVPKGQAGKLNFFVPCEESNFKCCSTKQLLNMFKLWREWGISLYGKWE